MKAPRFWWDKPGATAALLSPFAAVYGAVAARRLEQSGARAGIPVICVGNPTVGGSGKTPGAIAIARLLIDAGERPFFLTRGYGGGGGRGGCRPLPCRGGPPGGPVGPRAAAAGACCAHRGRREPPRRG